MNTQETRKTILTTLEKLLGAADVKAHKLDVSENLGHQSNALRDYLKTEGILESEPRAQSYIG